MIGTVGRALSALLLLLLWSLVPDASAQTAAHVAVVVNDASADSARVAAHYIDVRHIPADNVLHIRTATTEEIARPAYAATIEAPIARLLAQRGLQDTIRFIVLTRGVPLRIAGTTGQSGTVASVDSELTLLYRRMLGQAQATAGFIANPYYLSARPIGEAQSFSHEQQDIYLVTRLDGFSVDDALALIDRAAHPRADGSIVLDLRGISGSPEADDWLKEAATRLGDMGRGKSVALDKSLLPAPPAQNVLGYYSWGSNDPSHTERRTFMGFVPGAIAGAYVSTDARTLAEPPHGWRPGRDWKDQTQWFKGSPQSLVGDLIREGVTGVSGHVAEPYLHASVRPQVLFPAYVSGFTLAESFYLATPYLSWQTIVFGDPLCRPFPAARPAPREARVDPATGLTEFFSDRSKQIVRTQLSTRNERSIALAVTAGARALAADAAGERAALQQLVDAEPALGGPQLRLAILLDQQGEYDAAIKLYRGLIAREPRNALALNNLAYDLAEHRKAAREARPLARRALALLPREATVLDTAGWIEHLLGDSVAGSKLLTAAVAAAPANAEIRLHAAFAYHGSGAHAAAKQALDVALRLSPALASRDDVQRLQRAIASKRPQ